MSLYLNNRFFTSLGLVVFIFIVGYFMPWAIVVGKVVFLLFLMLVMYEYWQLFRVKDEMVARRVCASRFSNGDQNTVEVYLENRYAMKVAVRVIDEIPFQFQRRDLDFRLAIPGHENRVVKYELRPVERGEYHFGRVNVFVGVLFGLVSCRYYLDREMTVKVYPSYLQLRKYELMAISNRLQEKGLKKIRKIGHNIEFEHIKEYVRGDDFRTVNWKATARRSDIMVNVFQDEKSQHVYSVIDKGRAMQMPFDGLSLLDYAINASLVISDIAIKKDDKAGLITFEKQFEGFLPADRKRDQMHQILQFLYNQRTTFGEPDYSRLFLGIKNRIRRRSLLLLYTNFESVYSLDRQLPYLKKIAKSHLLVVIFFKNTEVYELANIKADKTEQVYEKVIAEKFIFEKQQIVKKLRLAGIQTILTKPEELSVDVINKYLEMKARRMV